MDIRYNLSMNQLEWSGPIKLLSFSNDGMKIYMEVLQGFEVLARKMYLGIKNE